MQFIDAHDSFLMHKLHDQETIFIVYCLLRCLLIPVFLRQPLTNIQYLSHSQTSITVDGWMGWRLTSSSYHIDYITINQSTDEGCTKELYNLICTATFHSLFGGRRRRDDQDDIHDDPRDHKELPICIIVHSFSTSDSHKFTEMIQVISEIHSLIKALVDHCGYYDLITKRIIIWHPQYNNLFSRIRDLPSRQCLVLERVYPPSPFRRTRRQEEARR